MLETLYIGKHQDIGITISLTMLMIITNLKRLDNQIDYSYEPDASYTARLNYIMLKAFIGQLNKSAVKKTF
jgi:hypothetical protein